MAKIDKSEKYMIFYKPRTQAIRALNNTYVINTIARRALTDSKDELEAKRRKKLNYEIPTISGDSITVAKQKAQIVRLLNNAINRDLYSQAIIAGVAITEDYLVQSLMTILSSYPQKLSTNDKKIDLSIILNSDNLEDLLLKIIEKQVHSVFYDSPAKYFEYIERIFAISIRDDIKEKYTEIKATRDILVHNAGIINNLYIQKAGRKARGAERDEIPLDATYFDDSVRCMKRAVTDIFLKLTKKYSKTIKPLTSKCR